MAGDGSMKGFVLDTSVILKWFSDFEEADLDQALLLRQAFLEGKVLFVVPDLLFYELANALRHNPNFSKGDVEEAVHSVYEMGLEAKGAEESVMAEAISLAFKYDLAVYDAYFLALSKNEGKPFITADYRFVERLKGFREIIKLRDISEIDGPFKGSRL
jgi:predicted nucleic acid-binding protein